MMLYPPIILFVSEMLIYILCVDLCNGCGIQVIYFVLSVIWRKANKYGINGFQNRVYIFAKMTKGVKFP